MEPEENTAPEHELQFGGHDFVFVDEPSSEQFCSVCLLVMKNAVQTVCGHRFCRHCLVGTFREGQHACPQDRNPIPEEGGFFPDVAWERNILSLRVKCKMSKRGCDWTGQLRHFQSHSDECQYEDVTCDDCDEEMQRRFLDTHLTSECSERVVQCVYCKDEFAFWRLELHQRDDCTRLPLACPQQCGVQDIPREEVESHVKDDCSMTVVVCPYEEAGCTFHDKRAYLKAHIEKSGEDHLGKTWSVFLKTKHELNEVKGNVDEIQVSVKTLLSEKEAMQMSLQRSNEEFGELKLSERKLEVENMSLKKEMTELGRMLQKVKESAATENRSLKGVVQTMQRKLEALEREGTKSKPINFVAKTKGPMKQRVVQEAWKNQTARSYSALVRFDDRRQAGQNKTEIAKQPPKPVISFSSPSVKTAMVPSHLSGALGSQSGPVSQPHSSVISFSGPSVKPAMVPSHLSAALGSQSEPVSQASHSLVSSQGFEVGGCVLQQSSEDSDSDELISLDTAY